MSITKRIFIYFIRSKKNLILILLLAIISLVCFCSIYIYSGSRQAERDTEEAYGTGLRLTELGKATFDYAIADEEFIEKVMKIDGVVAYNLEAKAYLYAKDWVTFPGLYMNLAEEYKENENWESQVKEYINWNKMLTPLGVSDSAYEDHFRTGTLELVEGRHIEPEETKVILISEDFAKLNELKIESQFSAYADCYGTSLPDETVAVNNKPKKEMVFTIIGIYKINNKTEPSYYTAESDMGENQLFINVKDVPESMKLGGVPYMTYNGATVLVDDISRIDKVMKEIYQIKIKGVSTGDIVAEKDDTLYRTALEPLHYIQKLMFWMLVVVIVVTFIILYQIYNLVIRQRKEEIHVLLTIGKSKREIMSQMIMEGMLLAMIAVTLSAAFAGNLADKVGNAMFVDVKKNYPTENSATSDDEMISRIQSGQVKSELNLNETAEQPERLVITTDVPLVLGVALAELAVISMAVAGAAGKILKKRIRDI